MKRYLLLLIAFSVSFLKGQEIKKEIEVKQATVFLQGAKVFGSTSVTLQKGRNMVRIINLPNNLDENTYKINLEKNYRSIQVILEAAHKLIINNNTNHFSTNSTQHRQLKHRDQ